MQAGTLWTNYGRPERLGDWLIPESVVEATTADNWLHKSRVQLMATRFGTGLRIWWPKRTADYWPQ